MVEVGDVVVYYDHKNVPHKALLTAVWKNEYGEGEPGVNLVYVSEDPKETDPYGRQFKRETSVVHKSKQYAPGNYWTWVVERDGTVWG